MKVHPEDLLLRQIQKSGVKRSASKNIMTAAEGMRQKSLPQ